ncbi:MAG TPA: hypothetical protein VF222_09005 [Nitrososphaeraceae archaeon]
MHKGKYSKKEYYFSYLQSSKNTTTVITPSPNTETTKPTFYKNPIQIIQNQRWITHW